MIWYIETKDGKVELNDFQLLNMLSAKVVEKERSDHEALAQALIRRLQTSGDLSDITLTQLACMSFELGYFYHIFKKNNTVDIVEVPSEGTSNPGE